MKGFCSWLSVADLESVQQHPVPALAAAASLSPEHADGAIAPRLHRADGWTD